MKNKRCVCVLCKKNNATEAWYNDLNDKATHKVELYLFATSNRNVKKLSRFFQTVFVHE